MPLRPRTWIASLAALSLAFISAEHDVEAAPKSPAAATIQPATPQPAPFRQLFGWSYMYIPSYFRPVNGAYDVIFHFHGAPQLQEENLDRLRLNAVVISINIGIGSGPYEDAYSRAPMFDKLLADTQDWVQKSGRAPGAHMGRIALSAWSAGFGGVGAILSHPEHAARIDSVLLADALHSSYNPDGTVHDKGLAKYANYAKRAMSGDRLMVMTHSSIGTVGYASSTEATHTLLQLTSMNKAPRVVDGPRGMHQIYESHRGNFHVFGYEGTQAKDHIDHVKGMSQTSYPYLKQRWETP